MKEGRKLVIGLSATLGLLCVVPLSLSVLTFALPSVYAKTFYGEMKDKIALIEKEQDERIIIIGGSSVPFSIDSTLIKKELPTSSPIDFGLYASLGTTFMLDIAKENIREGDIVVISPEQSSQTLSTYFNAEEAWKALDSNLSYVWKINNANKPSLIAEAPNYVGDKFKYLTSSLPAPEGIYHHDSFNEYGDIKVDRPYNILPNGIDSNNPISLSFDVISDDFISYLNDFYHDIWKKGAKLYYRFAPMNESSISNIDNLDAYYDYLNSKLNFPIMGNPHNSVMEKEWFYDTNYHLNSSGQIKFTKAFIQDLKLLLKDTSKTDIDDPIMPSLPEPSVIEGDNSDLSCFVLEDSGDNYIITGLSEGGKTKEKLIVPVSYNDKAIISFSASTFQNNSYIKEITVQRNIRSIADYSFSSSSLEKLILDVDSPNRISVGTHLLDGCDAYIYVDQNLLNSFIVNYFYSLYADRIKAR